jgi:hypothetical protein
MSTAPFAPGDRIELVRMPDDPDPIPAGTQGTVEMCLDQSFIKPGSWQVVVKWDIARSLSLVVPPDVARKVA